MTQAKDNTESLIVSLELGDKLPMVIISSIITCSNSNPAYGSERGQLRELHQHCLLSSSSINSCNLSV